MKEIDTHIEDNHMPTKRAATQAKVAAVAWRAPKPGEEPT